MGGVAHYGSLWRNIPELQHFLRLADTAFLTVEIKLPEAGADVSEPGRKAQDSKIQIYKE